ncbi:GtrA family protein [Aquilutibacter rugosus]|uniref:GtrA family protein n=1 Tax=Aquilutibacter rugosus TaxID=3115820 RepID=UPI002F3F6FD5
MAVLNDLLNGPRGQFIKFVLAGGTAAIANFGSRILLSNFMEYVPAIVLAYCVGMATAFILNRMFVFSNPTNSTGNQVFWFVAVNLFAVLQTLLISVGLAKYFFPMIGWTWQPELVAHAFGVVVPVFTSFIGHKLLTFRSV